MPQQLIGNDRHLLGLKGLSKDEITSILDRAQHWDRYPDSIAKVLPGTFIANMFLRIVREHVFHLKLQRSVSVQRC